MDKITNFNERIAFLKRALDIVYNLEVLATKKSSLTKSEVFDFTNKLRVVLEEVRDHQLKGLE